MTGDGDGQGSAAPTVGRTTAMLMAGGSFGLGVLIASMVAIALPDGGSSGPTTTVTSTVPFRSTYTPTVSAPTAAAAPGIGQPVVTGGMQFVVNSVRRSPTIPDDYNPERAAGEFVVVDMTVTNVGTQQEQYRSQYQRLIVGGQMIPYAGMPTYKLMDNEITVDLNPGIRLNTSVVFDVAVGTQPDSIEVHDDSSSPGAYISLR